MPSSSSVSPPPHKANEKYKPAVFAKTIYKGRARIEQAVGKLKHFKWIALRCEKTKRNFASFVAVIAGFILIKYVHSERAETAIQLILHLFGFKRTPKSTPF